MAVECVLHENGSPGRSATESLVGLEEAESELSIAKRYASHDRELADIIYNLAGVFALKRNRDELIEASGQLSTKRKMLAAIRAICTITSMTSASIRNCYG